MKTSLNKLGKNGLPLFRKVTDVNYNTGGRVEIKFEDVEQTPNGNEIHNESGFQNISGEEGEIKYSTIRSEFNLDLVDSKSMALVLTL